MKSKLLPVAVSSAALLFASSAWANGPDGASEYDWYTTIFAGAAFGQDLDITADFGEGVDNFQYPLDTGYLVGWTLGYDDVLGGGMIGLRPEVELSFRQQDIDLDELGEGPEGNISYPTDVLSLLANVWVDFEMNGVTPYVGGGIGFGWADLPVESVHIESTDMVWQFGGGFNYDVNEWVFLGIGYRYFGGDFEETIESTNLEYEYRSHEVLASLGARF